MNPLVVKKVQRRPFEAVTSSRTPFLHSLELVYRKVPQFVLKAVLPCKAYAWSSFFRLNTNTREKKCWSTSHKHWSATQLSGNGKKADLNGSRGSFTVTTQTEKAHWIKYIQTESRMRGRAYISLSLLNGFISLAWLLWFSRQKCGISTATHIHLFILTCW